MKNIVLCFISLVFFPVSYSANASVTNKVDEIFIQCSYCAPGIESPELLQVVQQAIDLYNQQAVQQGGEQASIGNKVQIEQYHHNPGGYSLVDHFFTIANYPVNSWSDLIDNGLERDHEQTFLAPPPNGDAWAWVAAFAAAGGQVSVYVGSLPFP